jgi:hypothetical protein
VQFLSFDEFSTWCGQHGYHLENWVPSLVGHPDIVTIELRYPKSVQLLTELIDELVGLDEEAGNIVVWLRDWTIWDERSANIGLCHLKLLSSQLHGEGSSVPGNLIELAASEWQEAIALVTVPILYSWDAHMLFASGRALVNISHHDVITVMLSGNDKQSIEKLAKWQAISE